MYQNTKLFWVTIVAVAILSMFHSSVSLGDSVLQVMPEHSSDKPKFYVKGFSTRNYSSLPITIFPSVGPKRPIYTYLWPLEKPLKSNGLSYEWQIVPNTELKSGWNRVEFCVVKNRYRSDPCWKDYCKKNAVCDTTDFEYVPKQSPKLEINANNRLRPIWSWDMDASVEKCQCQLDGGKAYNCKGSFQPGEALSDGIHTFNVLFTYSNSNGDKKRVKVEYNTWTGKQNYLNTAEDELDDSDTAEIAGLDTAEKTKQDAANAPATNGEQGATQNQNACNDRPPRKFTLSGEIVDAKTRQGIPGAKLVVLVPGTFIYEYDAFLDSSSILSQAVTDKLGKYTLSRQLRNGRKYSMFIIADGYERYKLDERPMKSCSKHFTENFKLRPLHY
ncbi:secreted protein [Beggiatoa sp. PS]|nr:secreted protein [Beggiatoa sp. PS]